MQQESAFIVRREVEGAGPKRGRQEYFSGLMETGSAGEGMRGAWGGVVRGPPSLRDVEVVELRKEQRKHSGERSRRHLRRKMEIFVPRGHKSRVSQGPTRLALLPPVWL